MAARKTITVHMLTGATIEVPEHWLGQLRNSVQSKDEWFHGMHDGAVVSFAWKWVSHFDKTETNEENLLHRNHRRL